MRLGYIYLDNVDSVNAFEEVPVLKYQKGNDKIYIRLVDLSRKNGDGFLRFIPTAGSAVTVTLNNIDSAKKGTKVASNPFVDDKSIFMIPMMPTDSLVYNGITISLSMGGATYNLYPQSTLVTEVANKNFA